ncbi:MAG: hypothetical protein LBE56_02805 [Tannerella sp.]|jgi:hypothetical protein|nr:hypothetical protein [Tannerella sp.]
MDTITDLTESKTVPAWIPTRKDETFTSDDLIDAYLHGKKDAFATAQRLAQDKFNANIEKSKDITVNLLNILRDNNFTPIDAYLRFNGFDYFEIMVTIPEDDFTADGFSEMYDVISGIEDRNNEKYYEVFISFCPVNEHFEELIVSSDGYLLKLLDNDTQRTRSAQ